MRVLLDECVPEQLRRELAGHDARTARYMGWSGKKNGALLAVMKADGFEVLLTIDRNIPHQQNLAAAGVSVILMTAHPNLMPDLLPLVPAVITVLTTIQPGDVVEITA